ncbi:MAG: VCBS repeat-containing protein [Acidobacteria bacterium]|nr:VCBS repeat-containing protein [Acidobacteriota bacterium]MBK8147684.1 VCBS repeat-containing protein [Acidobacteriota bacterium]MBK8812534.1 VCBS repeat-containing protein [Acidobacteriota bacterium]
MKKANKNGQIWKVSLVLIAIFAWVSAPFVMNERVSANAAGVPVLTLTATLTAPGGGINPHGLATYTVYDDGQRELEVESQDVNAVGAVLTSFLNGNAIGQATVGSDLRARLKLRTQDGQTVPTVSNGMTVDVKNGATTILSGVFGGGTGGTPTPTATPTGSPTATPTGSPTASPTATPTASPTASPTPTGSPSPSPSPSPGESEIYAILNGATINGILPRGYAAYEIHSSRTEIEARVYQVNLPAGTSLAVSINDAAIGSLVLETGGEGRLRLRSDRGDTVPVVTPGATITMKNGGTTVLSGTFTAAGGPTPSPSPNSTPQGRYFEGHLNGAQLTPAVTTNAIGEMKVLLNAAETQATVTGEFNRFTSTQTSARVQVTVGDVTTTIVDLGVVPSPEGEGHFNATTVNVTAQQVQLLRMGSWFAVIGSANNPSGEIGGRILNDSHNSDFDGDGSNDLSVFRPSTGTWYSQNGAGFTAATFGNAADVPMSADYDGDGKTDRAVFRNVNGLGVWEVNRSADGGVTATQFGFATDRPVRGDFDGDGLNDLAVFRPETGTWYVRNSNNTGYTIRQFGIAEDVPMSHDMDGDGKGDITVFRPSTGDWYSVRSSDGGITILHFGAPGDKPVRGDFDGDGRDDIAVYRPSTGVWFIWNSGNGSYDIRQFGISEDIPVAGNYDGDNKTDIAVFRPSTGQWYIWRSVDNTYDFRQFGLSGDIPTAR